MKKFFLISILFGVMPLSMVAQTDDLYFVPKKKVKKATVENTVPEQETYYSGSNRTVEEYNRLESKYEVLDGDSTKSDIIDFSAEKGVYPDSLKLDSLNSEDFELTKKLQRFDDYDIADNVAFWAGYEKGRNDYMWHSPWYYRTYGWYGGWYDPWYYGRGWYYSGWYGWYDPWYDPWFDPWYYGWYSPWHYSWHSPYYYGYYSWHYPRYYYYGGGGGRHYAYNGVTGTQHHGRINFNGPRGISNGRSARYANGTFGGSSIARSSSDRSRFGTTGTRNSNLDARGSSRSGRVTNSYGTFGGNRRNSGSYNGGSGSFGGSSSRSSGSYSGGSYSGGSSSRSSAGSGSFGGSRGGGGTIGGSRSGGGGGGSFGGRRH